MGSFGWLHLTDLHLGVNNYQRLWPNIQEILFQDLAELHSKCGPWELVLFTGDLVQEGSIEEFRELDQLLKALWDHLSELGSEPVFLCVPGNHDLERPDVTLPEVEVLRDWEDKPHIQSLFWNEASSCYRNVVNLAFANYLNWYGSHKLAQPENMNKGMLPGDFSATIENKEGEKIGILGLNTSFLQLTSDKYEGKLGLDVAQFHAACGGNGPEWIKQHHVCILMTHHPPDWLTMEGQEYFNGEIYIPGRFAVHLFGHMHGAMYRAIAIGASKARRFWQGCSLFGLEHWEDDDGSMQNRRHGYSAGRIEVRNGLGQLRLWPRVSVRQEAGHLRILQDQSNDLMEDQGTPPEEIPLTIPASGHMPERAKEKRYSGIPLPPKPYFVHPYPLQKNFTGRLRERRVLSDWLTKEKEPVMSVEAIGGMGKSALAWVWAERDIPMLLDGDSADTTEPDGNLHDHNPHLEGLFWWSFYERDSSFEAFVREALLYVSGGNPRLFEDKSISERVISLINLLREGHFLLVLDGFERELRAYASISAVYQGDEISEAPGGDHRECIDKHAADFLRRATSLEGASRILITTRLLPHELEDLEGHRSYKLEGMIPDDAVEFAWSSRVQGTRFEIREACAPYGYNALAIRLLIGVVLWDKRQPGDISVAPQYSILPELKGKEKHHILQVAYESMDEKTQLLLSQIAAFRNPMTYDMLSVCDVFGSELPFDKALDELINRGLLFFDRENRRYDLHPIVRQHAYDQLTSKKEIHKRLRGYFEAAPLPGDDTIDNIDDLSLVIELYHHTVREERYDQAFNLYRDRLKRWLFNRFAAYQICIELLKALFTQGKNPWPLLKSRYDQAEAFSSLGNLYSRTGQPHKAIPLYKAKNDIDKRGHNNLSLATGLSNLGTEQIAHGALRDAYKSLNESLRLSQAVGSDQDTAYAHQRLGWLYTITGNSQKAEEELERALELFTKSQDNLGKGVVLRIFSGYYLSKGNVDQAIHAGRMAYALANEENNEFETIYAEYVLGRVLLAPSVGKGDVDRKLTQVEAYLSDALTRCRRVSLVSIESNILLSYAEWYRESRNLERAKKSAEDSLYIANRCKYRLCMADCHNFLAQLALDRQDPELVIQEARKALDLAKCDYPAYSYRYGVEKAKHLLKEARPKDIHSKQYKEQLKRQRKKKRQKHRNIDEKARRRR